MPDLAIIYDMIFKAVGFIVIAGGGIGAISLAIFKGFGEKWLDGKFAKRMAVFHHEHERELERLRFEINSLMDRKLKLHQKEFDVLPEAWARLNEANTQAHSVTSSMKQFPMLDGMDDADAMEFLDNESSFFDFQKKSIIDSRERDKEYMALSARYEFSNAMTVLREYDVYFGKNGIFIPESLTVKFNRVSELIHGALIEYEMYVLGKITPHCQDERKLFRKDGPEILKSLESDIQVRLWN